MIRKENGKHHVDDVCVHTHRANHLCKAQKHNGSPIRTVSHSRNRPWRGEAYPSHVRNDVASARFNVKVADIKVAAIRYDNTGFGNQGHNMDVARFASNSRSPEIEINVTGDDEINSVTIHPVRFYPQEKLKISPDKRLSYSKWPKNYPTPLSSSTETTHRMPLPPTHSLH